MNLLLNASLTLDLKKEYEDILRWNLNQKDNPLRLFTKKVLDKEEIYDSDYFLSVAERVYEDLSLSHAAILYKVLSEYNDLYATLGLASYFESINNFKEALKLYSSCQFSCEGFELIERKVQEMKDKIRQGER